MSHRAIAIGLVAATCASFWPVLSAEFVWDDYGLFVENEAYRGLSPSRVAWMLTSTELGHWQPLTWLTWGLDYAWYGLDPTGYHLTSLLVHALNACLFYALLLVLWERLAGGAVAETSARARRLAAAGGALLFALHPLRVESVAWVTERGGMLAATFMMLTTIAWMRAWDGDGERPRPRRYALALAMYALAVCSKAWGMTLWVSLLVLSRHPGYRLARIRLARVSAWIAPFAALGLGTLVVAYVAKRGSGALDYAADHTLAQRVAQAAYGLCFYAGKLVWPADLNVLYVLERDLDPSRPVHVASIGAVVGLTALLVVLRRRWPAGLVAWAVCVITAAPVLGATQGGFQVTADRYTYLVSMPLVVLAASGLLLWGRRAPRSAATATVLVCGLLGLLSNLQARTWRNPDTLWSNAIEDDPTNWFAHHNRGFYLQRIGLRRQKEGLPWRADLEAAIAAFGEAIRHQPDRYEDYHFRGAARMRVGDVQGARADLDRAVELHPDDAELRLDRALSYLGGADVHVQKAGADVARALELDPGFAKAHFTQGNLHLGAGRLADAAASLERALQGDLDPPVRDVATAKLREVRRALEERRGPGAR